MEDWLILLRPVMIDTRFVIHSPLTVGFSGPLDQRPPIGVRELLVVRKEILVVHIKIWTLLLLYIGIFRTYMKIDCCLKKLI